MRAKSRSDLASPRGPTLKTYVYDNITAAQAVDREFVYIVEPVVLSLVAFGSTLGSLWLAQAPLGAFGPPPEHHLDPMWVPLALPWAPLAILGLPGRFELNLESNPFSRSMLLKYHACAQNIASRNS